MLGVALGICAIYALSTLPTPLYVLYQRALGFSKITLTLVYAAYVVGTIASMFFFGRVSDQVGRRPVVLLAMGVAVATAVLFIFVRETAWLFTARILSGLAVALAAGAGTAWIAELEPRHDRSVATRITTGANCLGLGMGPLLAGLLAQYVGAPLRVVYVVFIALLVPVIVVLWRVPTTSKKVGSLRQVAWKPKLGVPREIRAAFIPAAIGTFALFAVLGYYTALIPSLLSESLHIDDHAVAGAVVSGMFVVATIAVFSFKKLSSRRGLEASLIALLVGLAILVVAEVAASMSLLLLAAAVGGAAIGLGYRSTLEVINEIAPEDKRGEVVATYLVVCYTAISIPIVGVGIVSTTVGSLAADVIFAGVVGAFAIVALISTIRSSSRRQ